MTQRAAEASLLLQTTSHREEKFAEVDTSYGPDYNYKAVQQDEQLLLDFEDRLAKLEGLVYVARGSVPESYRNNQGWQLRDDVRCLWPGQEFIQADAGHLMAQQAYYWPTAARGAIGLASPGTWKYHGSTGYYDWSRSCDILRMQADWQHLRHPEFFPPGNAITWDRHNSDNYDDPKSSDGSVTVTYHVPEPVRSRIVRVRIQYNHSLRPSGSVESTFAEMATADGGETYTYTFSSLGNNHCVAFVLRVETNDDPPIGSGYYENTVIDPPHYTDGWNTPPGWCPSYSSLVNPGSGGEDDVELQNRQTKPAYWFTMLDHVAPYEHGFPELLCKHWSGAAGIQRCTGTWRFDRLSSIPVGLINIARFMLDSFGRDGFQVHPARRGSGEMCCVDMPVIFRWSGGSVYPQYQDGGKSSSTASPLVAVPGTGDYGNDEARRYWRGIGASYYEDSAWLYGEDQSYLTWPHYVQAYLDDSGPWSPGIFPSGENRGLRPGDRVTRMHLLEIIEAVDWLLDNGLWWVEQLDSCKRTPTHCDPWSTMPDMGLGGGRTTPTCGDEWSHAWNPSTGYEDDWTFIGVAGYDFCETTPSVVPWAAPATAEDCRNATGTCVEAGAVEFWISFQEYCYGYYLDQWYHEWKCACGYNARFWDTLEDTFDAYCGVSPKGLETSDCGWNNRAAIGQTKGWSYYLCGPKDRLHPPGEDNGIDWSHEDANHGNGLMLQRSEYHSGGLKTCQSMGNNFDAALVCDTGGVDRVSAIAFDSVTGVQFNGYAQDWAARPNIPCPGGCSNWSDNDLTTAVPSLDEFGYYWPLGIQDNFGVRKPLCAFYDGECSYAICESVETALADIVDGNLCAGFKMTDDFKECRIRDDVACGTNYYVFTIWTLDSPVKECGVYNWLEASFYDYSDPERTVGILGGFKWNEYCQRVPSGQDVGSIDFITGQLTYSGSGTHVKWGRDLFNESQRFSCKFDIDDVLAIGVHCGATPHAYLSVDLNLQTGGIPGLWFYDRTITGSSGGQTVYPDEVGQVQCLPWDGPAWP